MRQWFSIALVIALAIVLVNDVSRIAAVHFATDNVAVICADNALTDARAGEGDPTAGMVAAQEYVASEDASLTAYSVADGYVNVTVSTDLDGTILIGPILSLWDGGSWSDPVPIEKSSRRRLT